MIKNRMAQRGQAGFTLIELLVVVAILAILVGVAVVGVGAMRKNANKSACKADRDTIQTAAEAFDLGRPADEVGDPISMTDLTTETATNPAYLKKARAGDDADWDISRVAGSWDAEPQAGALAKYGDIEAADCELD